MTIDELANLVCRNIPEDWELSIIMESGAGIVTLHDPQGDMAEDASSIDETIETQVIQALGYAKAQSKAIEGN